MKLQSSITVNGQVYAAGTDIAWYRIYPFFLVHMLMFGGSGFFMAYSNNPAPVFFLYLHGGFAILVYTVFYFALFGRDEVKWMFINAGLGSLGIYSQISWLLSFFGKQVSDYPFYVHVIPFLYYMLYTFLIRHALLDMFEAREDENRKQFIETGYIVLSIVVYAGFYWMVKK